jgi:hypothetical protein
MAVFNGTVTADGHYSRMTTHRNYAAYLLRWQWHAEHADWRATVENAHTGEKLQFVDKDELLHFLWQALQAAGGSVSADTPASASDPTE